MKELVEVPVLFSHDSDQLNLDLDDVRLRIPWEGRSPRGLTRVAKGLFLSQEAQKSVSDSASPELDGLMKNGAPYLGAPTLLPFKGGGDG